MTATEALERRIYDHCIVRVGQLEAEKYTLCERIDELCQENERLRQNNDGLRELVKAMKPFLCCMPFASCNTLAANVRNRMRELGVDDG